MERRGPIECHECGAEIWPDEDRIVWGGHVLCMECGQTKVRDRLDDRATFRAHVRELAEVLRFAVQDGDPVW